MLRCTTILEPNIPVLATRVLALAIAIGLSGPARASEASCVAVGSRNPRAEIDQFKREPARYLTYLRGDSDKIKGFISSFVASDPGVLEPLRRFIAQANANERLATGVGLANAAERCARTQPAVSGEIAQYVRKLDDANLSAGFLSLSPQTKTYLPSASRSRAAQGTRLIEGEHGDKLADPFAPIPLPD